MQLIENWKAALKMYSVQLALVFAAFEWYDNLMEVALPQTMAEWMYHLVGLVFVVLRVLSQPELYKKTDYG